MKDLPIDRQAPRQRLADALDALFAEELNPAHNLDAVESKLFGIGSESYVVGSHEFYLGYAITRKKLLCLDAGHFHPTETIADKISAVMQYLDRLLLHVSRGVRWDSDHVVILSDELRAIAQELVRGDYLDRVHIGLDYFDASHQPRGGLGDRHPGDDQGAAAGPARAARAAPPAGMRRRLHLPAGAARRTEIAPRRGGLGLLLPDPRRADRRRVVGGRAAVRRGCTAEKVVDRPASICGNDADQP